MKMSSRANPRVRAEAFKKPYTCSSAASAQMQCALFLTGNPVCMSASRETAINACQSHIENLLASASDHGCATVWLLDRPSTKRIRNHAPFVRNDPSSILLFDKTSRTCA
jgi:hypothetical protein